MIDEMELEDIHYMIRQLKKYNLITSDKYKNLVWIWMPPKKAKKMLKDCIEI